jgi:glycosyltransferase involved in cell wall biosynthesis
MSIKLSIIVPCYNEAENLPGLLEAFGRVIATDDIELVVVNNGSTDDTENIIQELLLKYSFATLVNVPINKGYGHGIKVGLSNAQGSFLGWTHADMQTDPVDVIKAFNIIRQQPHNTELYVKGDRKGRPFSDQFFTIGMSCFETIYMGKLLWDINAQPNIFHRTFFEKWVVSAPDDFSLDLYVLFLAQHLRLDVLRFPVFFPERVHGHSSWNTGLISKWKFIKRTVDFSIHLKKGLNFDPLYRP